VGCDGTVNGTGTFGWYFFDIDKDGLGGGYDFGWHCSVSTTATHPVLGTVENVVTNTTDFDDSCACTTSQGNTFAACYDCLGNCISNSPSDYLGDNTGLTNVCTYTSAAGRKGCDVCDVCNGSGYPYYTDADSDGWGVGTANSCTSAGNTNNNSDLDDTCDCYANTLEALTSGGSCKDECGICKGDGYKINCKDPLYIRAYNDSTGTCLNMDCSGECGGTDSIASNGDCCDNLFLCPDDPNIVVCLSNQVESLDLINKQQYWDHLDREINYHSSRHYLQLNQYHHIHLNNPY
jgi:hypothetical protein